MYGIHGQFGRRSCQFAIAIGLTAVVSLTFFGSPHGGVLTAADAACVNGLGCQPSIDGLQLSLPDGASQCVNSGTGATCSTTVDSTNKLEPGVASLPDGLQPCWSDPGHGIADNASCKDAAPPVLPTTAPVRPSVPKPVSKPAASVQHVSLSVSASSVGAMQNVVLTAISGASVSGTANYIEVFDASTGTLVGACNQGSQCDVAYAAPYGAHKFTAFLTPATSTVPSRPAGTSNSITVRWTRVRLRGSATAVGPGKPITLSAGTDTAANPHSLLQVYDADNGARLSYCSKGVKCSFNLVQGSAGTRRFVAALAAPSPTLTADVKAQSAPLQVTWLAVNLVATSSFQIGSAISLTATTNADLTTTPWSLGIFDNKGRLVGRPCKSGTTCSAQVVQPSLNPAPYTAVVGQAAATPPTNKIGKIVQVAAGPSALVNEQARSSAVKPLQLLWGVDSCRSFTDLYPQIQGILGTPDFWGRYLTNTVCPGISQAEVAAAHSKHMGILPIYNDYNCSNVAGYDTATQYAVAAVSAAHRLGIPQGRGLAIDIEPPGDACPGAANLDTGFLHGWYDAIKAAGYAPIFYGDGTSGSAFATQWCYTVNALPYIGQNSYLWSFQPSLLGGYMRSNAPGYSPNITPCVGYVHAWQYQIGSESWAAPDVDGDEATSELPLWYP